MIKTVAIAQPTFLPWTGWFDLADQVDLMIILDDVAFSKQSWQQRNRVRTREGLAFVTAPVKSSGRLGQRILETALADMTFAAKVLRTIAQNYSRALNFSSHFSSFSVAFDDAVRTGNLCEMNCQLIDWLWSALKLATPRIRASELNITGKRGEYVAKLCDATGARRYVSPAGAVEYLLEDQEEFASRSIDVVLHEYAHPVYRQCFQPFLPFASALDLILNEGEAAGDIMRSGRRRPRRLGESGLS